MTEENTPELFQSVSKEKTKEKKRKIPSKKKWLEMVGEFIEINPQMPPGEVIRRTKLVTEGQNPNKSEEERQREDVANALRKERLRREGYDPSEWTYSGTAMQPKAGWNTPFTEEDMRIAHARFPDEIELVVSQGHIAPASEPDRRGGKEFYDVNHFWDMFIRIKPQNALETPPTQIEGPAENPQ